MAVYLFDPDGGNNANDGLTFANRKRDWAGMGNGANGDEWRVMAARDPHSLGNAQWTNGSNVVTLATAKTLNIDTCDAAWTASANVTCTVQSTSALARAWRQGTGVSRAVIVSAFTTGIVAYKALPAPLDLSAFSAVAFRLAHNVAFVAGNLILDLCSDAVGAVPVASLVVPVGPTINTGYNCFIENGAALPAVVNSIALRCTVDPGAATLTMDIDNIFACQPKGHADHLCLDSMIGKETVGEPEMWPIKSIDGTTVTIGAYETVSNVTGRLYSGATELVTTYSQQTQHLLQTLTGGQDVYQKNFTGGWNRTDMSTRTSKDTFLAGRGCIPYAYQRTSPNVRMTQFSLTGFSSGVAQYGTLTGDIAIQGRHASGNAAIAVTLETFIAINFDYMVMNTVFGTGGNLNPFNVRAAIKSKLWGECNGPFWQASVTIGQLPPDSFTVELGLIRNCANAAYGVISASTTIGFIPLKNTVFSGNAGELDDRYSYALDNVTFARTAGAYSNSSSLGSKIIYTRKGGDDRICGFYTYMMACEVQTVTIPPSGDTAAWRFNCRTGLPSYDGKYPRAPILSFGLTAGKTYTVAFSGRRPFASDGARVEACLPDGTSLGYADFAGATNTWLPYSFNFVAAADSYATVFFGLVANDSDPVYCANFVITEV